MFELIIAICLIALNGVFALSELAVVSARRPRLQAMAEKGRPGAKIALKLMEDSGRFLSTVQIGITLVGILAGAFSGAALGARLTQILAANGVPPEYRAARIRYRNRPHHVLFHRYRRARYPSNSPCAMRRASPARWRR